MRTNYLFPNRYKKIGWFIFVPGILLGIVFLIYQSEISLFDFKVFAVATDVAFSKTILFSFFDNNILDEVSSVLIIIGALLIAFSKEEYEDEFII